VFTAFSRKDTGRTHLISVKSGIYVALSWKRDLTPLHPNRQINALLTRIPVRRPLLLLYHMPLPAGVGIFGGHGRKLEVKTRRLLCGALSLMLVAGGCKDRADENDKALLRAAEAGDSQAVTRLIQRHGDVNTRAYDGRTPLHHAAEKGHASVVQALVQAGARLNVQDDLARTPVDMAIWRRHADIVRLLVDSGADVDLRVAAYLGNAEAVKGLLDAGKPVNGQDWLGCTALHYAVARGYANIAAILLACGASVDGEGGAGHDTPLHIATETGRKELAELLIAKGANVDARNDGGITPLHEAVRSGDKEIVELLVARGADLNAVTANGGAPLHIAIAQGRKEIMRFLLAKGADLNTKSEFDGRPLHVAIRGDPPVARALIARGADVNATDEEGFSPLHFAASVSDANLVELLVAKGARVDLKSVENWTPLHSAACGGSREIVDFLIAKGASVNVRDAFGETPLHCAAAKGYKEIVELLIAKGAKLNAKDTHGGTPLGVAFRQGHRDIAFLLMDKGADVNAGGGLIHEAFQKKDEELMKVLIAHNANFNAQDSSGETLLHVAAFTGDRELATLSLAHGADVGTKDKNGDTTLHLAAKAGHRELAELLITNGADVNAKNRMGSTPLHLAARGHKDVAELLLVNGADIDAQNKLGDTPLHAAALRGYKDVTELLVASGANVEITANNGQTAADKAARGRHADIVQLLKSGSKNVPGPHVRATVERPSSTMPVREPDSAAAVGDMAQKRAQMQPTALSPQGQARRDARTFVQGNSAFACDLYRQLATAEGNLFLSPHSISVALAMAYAGARGTTEAQMAKTLRFSLDQERLHAAFRDLQKRLDEVQASGEVTLHVANSLWPHQKYPFLDAYLALLKEQYGVSITPVDYENALEAARIMINEWVEQNTQDKIRNVIPAGMLDTLARLVLVNTIYFKGTWEHQFDPAKTKDEPFHVTPEKTIQVPMMAQSEYMRYGETENLQVLELPYVGEDLSMLVLLPKKIDGLAGLEASLSMENLDLWRQSLTGFRVHAYLPKFQMTAAFLLSDVLKTMGMVNAFTWPGADFAGMDGSKMLYISEVIHKAFVNVDEEGTEAAAATVVLVRFGGAGPVEPTFRADHPFLFLIQENRTGSILFLGRVVDPS
jgi:ankyrin repeat protein/serine protease inhibitor